MKGQRIIVDLEWEPEGEDKKLSKLNALQLGAAKVNETGDLIDTFYSIIKPEKSISDIGLVTRIMPVTEQQLFSGDEKLQVIEEFLNWCGETPMFIIWGSINCKALKLFIGEYVAVDKKTNILDLQVIYKIMTGNSKLVSFYNACLEKNIEMVYPLHNSLNDSLMLTALYHKMVPSNIESIMEEYYINKAERKRLKRLQKRRRQSAEKKRLNSLRRAKCVISNRNSSRHHYYIIEGSNLIHRRNCNCLHDVGSMKGYSSLFAIMKDYECLCPECFHGQIWFPSSITRLESIRILDLHTLCSEFSLSSEHYGDTVIINTRAGSWYIEIGNKIPTLYHRNDIFPWKNRNGAILNYHKQKKEFRNDLDMIKYIYKHDKQLLKLLEKKKGDLDNSLATKI